MTLDEEGASCDADGMCAADSSSNVADVADHPDDSDDDLPPCNAMAEIGFGDDVMGYVDVVVST